MDADDEYSGWIDWDQRNDDSWHADGLDEIDSFFHFGEANDNEGLKDDNRSENGAVSPHSARIDNDMQQAAHILTSLQTSITDAKQFAKLPLSEDSDNAHNDLSHSNTKPTPRDSVIAQTTQLPSSPHITGLQGSATDATNSDKDDMARFPFENPSSHALASVVEPPSALQYPQSKGLDAPRKSQPAPHALQPSQEAELSSPSPGEKLLRTVEHPRPASPDPFRTPLKYGPGPPSSPNTGRKSLHEEIRKTVNESREFDDTPVRRFPLSSNSKRRKGGVPFNDRDNPTIPPTPEMVQRRATMRQTSAPTLRREQSSPVRNPRKRWSDPEFAIDLEHNTALDHIHGPRIRALIESGPFDLNDPRIHNQSSPSVRALAKADAARRVRHQRQSNSDSAIPVIPTAAILIDLSTPAADVITPAIIRTGKRGAPETAAADQAKKSVKPSTDASSSPDPLTGPPTKKRKGNFQYSTPEPTEKSSKLSAEAPSPVVAKHPISPERSIKPSGSTENVDKTEIPEPKQAEAKPKRTVGKKTVQKTVVPVVPTVKAPKPRPRGPAVNTSISDISDLSSLASDPTSSPPTNLGDSQPESSQPAQVEIPSVELDPVAGQKRKRAKGTHPLGARELAGMLGSVGDEGLVLNGISLGGSPRRTRRQKAEEDAMQAAPAAAAKKRRTKKK